MTGPGGRSDQRSLGDHRQMVVPMDVASRADRLRATMDEAGCDALCVTRLVNVRYLTGFTGSSAVLVVLPGELVLVTDGRYREQAAAELAAAGVVARVETAMTQEAQGQLLAAAAAGCARVGLEAEAVTWAQQQRYRDRWLAGCELVATTGLVEGLRLVKDAGEVARMEAAAAAADGALAVVGPRLVLGPTEAELALDLESEMRARGAAGPGFDTIVAAGPNASRPHHRPTDRPIGPGELVIVDFGAVVDGYRSDMTRTLCVGEPTAEARRMVEVVAESQRAGVAAVCHGAGAADVDAACRAVIEEAGMGEAFLHGTGHGVGLEVHEAPRLALAATGTLVEGSVVTVEPGVYLPGHGGARIEDMVLVTKQGCRALTNAPKELVVSP